MSSYDRLRALAQGSSKPARTPAPDPQLQEGDGEDDWNFDPHAQRPPRPSAPSEAQLRAESRRAAEPAPARRGEPRVEGRHPPRDTSVAEAIESAPTSLQERLLEAAAALTLAAHTFTATLAEALGKEPMSESFAPNGRVLREMREQTGDFSEKTLAAILNRTPAMRQDEVGEDE